MARRFLRTTLLAILLLLPTGCAAIGQFGPKTVPPPCNCACSNRVVFVADGVGDFEATTSAMYTASLEGKLPLCVEKVDWSHGYGRIVADQTDYANIREAGCRLAVRVASHRQAHPDSRVYLMGHSAGCAVVLAAAEALPPGSVERIVLLAPSVSSDYDLRPALRTVRRGIDVFYSERDQFALGFGTAVLGTADRKWTAPAGRVGFCPITETAADAALYQKLRQHPWDPSVKWTGNHGGHYATYQATYLRAYVLPLFQE